MQTQREGCMSTVYVCTHLLSIISLHVQEVGGEEAPVHALPVPGDAALHQRALLGRLQHKPLHCCPIAQGIRPFT